jgi:hypothetical protein
MKITTIALAAFFALGSTLVIAQGAGGAGGAGAGAGGAGAGGAGAGAAGTSGTGGSAAGGNAGGGTSSGAGGAQNTSGSGMTKGMTATKHKKTRKKM